MQHMHDVNVNCKNHSHLQDVIVGNRLHFTLIKVREKKIKISSMIFEVNEVLHS